jgi:hypothetical protein
MVSIVTYPRLPTSVRYLSWILYLTAAILFASPLTTYLRHRAKSFGAAGIEITAQSKREEFRIDRKTGSSAQWAKLLIVRVRTSVSKAARGTPNRSCKT